MSIIPFKPDCVEPHWLDLLGPYLPRLHLQRNGAFKRQFAIFTGSSDVITSGAWARLSQVFIEIDTFMFVIPGDHKRCIAEFSNLFRFHFYRFSN